MSANFILNMSDITKRFPGVLALDHVSLRVKKGEVHALLGENGSRQIHLDENSGRCLCQG